MQQTGCGYQRITGHRGFDEVPDVVWGRIFKAAGTQEHPVIFACASFSRYLRSIADELQDQTVSFSARTAAAIDSFKLWLGRHAAQLQQLEIAAGNGSNVEPAQLAGVFQILLDATQAAAGRGQPLKLEALLVQFEMYPCSHDISKLLPLLPNLLELELRYLHPGYNHKSRWEGRIWENKFCTDLAVLSQLTQLTRLRLETNVDLGLIGGLVPRSLRAFSLTGRTAGGRLGRSQRVQFGLEGLERHLSQLQQLVCTNSRPEANWEQLYAALPDLQLQILGDSVLTIRLLQSCASSRLVALEVSRTAQLQAAGQALELSACTRLRFHTNNENSVKRLLTSVPQLRCAELLMGPADPAAALGGAVSSLLGRSQLENLSLTVVHPSPPPTIARLGRLGRLRGLSMSLGDHDISRWAGAEGIRELTQLQQLALSLPLLGHLGQPAAAAAAQPAATAAAAGGVEGAVLQVQAAAPGVMAAAAADGTPAAGGDAASGAHPWLSQLRGLTRLVLQCGGHDVLPPTAAMQDVARRAAAGLCLQLRPALLAVQQLPLRWLELLQVNACARGAVLQQLQRELPGCVVVLHAIGLYSVSLT